MKHGPTVRCPSAVTAPGAMAPGRLHTYQPTNFNLLAMIINFEIVLLEMYNYTKRYNSFSTDAMATKASKPAAGAAATGRRIG